MILFPTRLIARAFAPPLCRGLLALVALCVATLMLPAAATAQARQGLDSGWRFERSDVQAAQDPDFDDSGWRWVTLPHSFNAGDGDDGGNYYRGTAWYRKALDLKALPASRRLYLQFDGAALVTDLFINGKFIGRHEGGYSTFRFDISKAVKPGRNVLAVRVSNAAWPQVAPLGGDFTVFGGLYRGVSLIEARDAGLDRLDDGSDGVFVSSAVSAKGAKLSIGVALRNQRSRAGRLIVQTRVFDAAGKPVLSVSKAVNMAAEGHTRVVLSGELAAPHLWNGRADPYLYSAVTEVSDDSAVLDKTSTAFGIRTVAFDPQKGLLLNGRPYAVNGVNLHSGRPGKGSAVSRADIVQDFDLIEEMGATAVRLVHYPHARTAYEEADRRGLLVLTEIPLVAQISPTGAFAANAAQQLRELIRQNRNHPSVIAWGLGNEVYATDPAVTALLRQLQALATAEDPTRPTIYAHCCQGDDDPKAQITGLIGFNRYFGWYPDQKGTLGEWADAFHKRFAGKALAVTEYGAGGSISQQAEHPAPVDPASGWHPEQAQALWHEKTWADLKARPYIWGRFVWQMFDSASDGRNEGDRAGINDKGLITYDRQTRKDAFWFYKAQWSASPVVYITSRRLSERHDARTDVRVYTNQPQVTLSVNGIKVATQSPVNGVVVFKSVLLSAGYNVVQADNGPYYDRVSWALSPPPAVLEPGLR